MTASLTELEQRRKALFDELLQLGDFRPGSVTTTGGRCGNPGCHCHRPNDPGHEPHARLTYKVRGKTRTESFPTPAAQRKAEQETANFRRFQHWSRAFVEVNTQICRLRPVEDTWTAQGKKRPKPSSKRWPKK